ncbi:MAG TPA: hypothetical protein VGO58_10650 [Chitinophagaceae bacterium]|nr:hypothetical protein [Chitinophagaceae bacterium]
MVLAACAVVERSRPGVDVSCSFVTAGEVENGLFRNESTIAWIIVQGNNTCIIHRG